MSNKKVSVIMSVFNNEDSLDKAIESILNQTFRDFEFIIINDASSDKSPQIIKFYKDKDKRIRYLENKKNIGLTASLNKALRAAKGEFIARIDADDISLSKRLELQVSFLENNKDIFLVGGGAVLIDEDGNNIGLFRPVKNITGIIKEIKKRNPIYHPTIMFRNNKGIFYREKFKYSQDYDLYLNLITSGLKLANIQAPLIKYRVNSNSISNTKAVKQRLFAAKAIEFYKERIRQRFDNYKSFNTEDIENYKIENIRDKEALVIGIKTSIKEKNPALSRNFYKVYHKLFGFDHRVVYYFITFIPIKFISLLLRPKGNPPR